MTRRRLPASYALAAAGYATGLLVSTALDLPSGPVIVWALVALAIVVDVAARRRGGAREVRSPPRAAA